MNQEQLKAIERLKKAYNNLSKEGLYFFLHESNGYVCKKKDLDSKIKDVLGNKDAYGQIEDIFKRNKALRLDIFIDNFNA